MPGSTTGEMPWHDLFYLELIHVDADDPMAQSCETDRRDGADITQSEDADVHDSPPRDRSDRMATGAARQGRAAASGTAQVVRDPPSGILEYADAIAKGLTRHTADDSLAKGC